MSDIYDLVIFAKGLHASILLAEAVDKGLKVAVVFGNDCNNNSNSPFIFTFLFKKPRLSLFLKSARIAKHLKKLAPHLINESKVEHFLAVCFKHRLFSGIINMLKSSTFSVIRQGKKSILKYGTYKFSSNRLSIELLKFAQTKGAHIYQYSSFISAQYSDHKHYKLCCINKLSSTEFSLYAKSYLVNPIADLEKIRESKAPELTDTSFWFTYPANEIDIRDNIFFENKNFKIFIIPWFNSVYFKISGSGFSSIVAAVRLIQINLNFIKIDIRLIKGGCLNENSSFFRKNHLNRLNFYYNNNQTNFSCPNIDDCFNHSHKTVIKIIKQIKTGNDDLQIIKKAVLPGSAFRIKYNPLRLMELADEKYDLAKQILKSPSVFKPLFYRYGSDIDLIIDKAYEYYNQTKNSSQAWLLAEIWYCKNHEMCLTAESFINTHTNIWMEDNSLEKDFINKIFSEL
jgi:hypothetical protein